MEFEIGREKFGYPITDESKTPDGKGRFNHFRSLRPDGSVIGDASIYWSPGTGAHEVYGAIRDTWAKRGWETSNVGYPTAAEQPRSDGPGRQQRFEHGRIVWSAETGAVFDPLVVSAPIVSGGLAALGGSVSVTVNLDGSARWQGHAHDSGADGYDFGISAFLRPPAGTAVAFAHTGHVGGTFTSGSRDHNWDDRSPPQVAIKDTLSGLSNGKFETNLQYTSNIGSVAESVLGLIAKSGIGTLSMTVNVVVFVGVEIGSLISTGSLVPGARVIEGVLWMAGPGNTLLALAAEGIANAGTRSRGISQVEYDWANAEVFQGALPSRDKLVLTDTIGPSNRAFTFPRFDGKITLNMGPDAFNDPRNYPNRPYGQVFIHELVHACQIQHTTIDLVLLAKAMSAKVCEVTGGNPYQYPVAGGDYTKLGLEQQAQIVSDWFSGNKPNGTNQTGVPKDKNSPYFRYVQENVRIGRF
jgi:hypothetical protein